MGLIIYSILFAIPAIVFSLLSWRLRTNLMFWLGILFTAILIFLYIRDLDYLIYCVSTIDGMIQGLFFLALLGIPIYFLISSKVTQSNQGSESEITDDYLNNIINSEDEEINFDD